MAMNEQDAAFLMQARPLEIADIKMSEVAVEYAQDPHVKEVAEVILNDHTRAHRILTQMLDGREREWPDAPDEAHETLIDKLWSLDGIEFDRIYAQALMRDHEQAVALFEREALSGQDAALRTYAQRQLPVLREHLERVRAIARSLYN